MAISKQVLTDILIKAKISDIVGRYIPLKQKGRNYWGVCPFHDDTSPSLSVSDEKKIYHCFTCGAGGNAIRFVQEFERVSFQVAVQNVCNIIGYENNEIQNIQQDVIDDDVAKIWNLNKEVATFYEYMLSTEPGAKAREYLENRKITPALCQKYTIGYAPYENKLIDFLKMKGFSVEEMYKAGVVNDNQQELSVHLQNRITFAIKDDQGNIIGFSGRAIGDFKPKYINTPETKVFKKGEFLYNFDQSFRNIRIKKQAIIVEGFMDVIALDKANITNTVAIMGTAFTHTHIKWLRPITKDIIVFMDSDDAGQMAAFKISEQIEKNGFNCKIVKPFNNLDADEILNQYSNEKLQDVIQNTISGTEYRINYLSVKIPINNIKGKKEFMTAAFKTISYLNDSFELDEYKKMIAHKINLSVEDLNKYITSPLIKTSHTPSSQYVKLTQLERGEKYILETLLRYPEQSINIYKEKLNFFINKKYKIIAAFLIHQFDTIGQVDLSKLMLDLDVETNSDQFSRIVSEFISETTVHDFSEQGLVDAIKIVRNDIKKELLSNINKEIKHITNQLQAMDDVDSQINNQAEKERLIGKAQVLLNKKKEIKESWGVK